jgi:hypothetical protein
MKKRNNNEQEVIESAIKLRYIWSLQDDKTLCLNKEEKVLMKAIDRLKKYNEKNK